MKVHLHGWFGFKNLGDDLLLQQAVNAIGAVDGVNRIEIGVDKHDYLDDFLNSNVDIVYSSRGMGYLFQSAFSNDALVIGPGGLFPHRNPIKVFVYLLLTGWWKVLGKKVLYFGLGATSLQDSFSINCWRHIASHSDAFLARDSDLLNACGIRETDTLYSAADAVFLGSDGDCIQTNQRIVAVAFANLYNRGEDGFDSFEADCAKLVKHLAEQTDKVELLSFTAGADEDLNKQIAGSLGFSNVVALSYEGTLAPSLISGSIHSSWECDFIQCCYLHGMVFLLLQFLMRIKLRGFYLASGFRSTVLNFARIWMVITKKRFHLIRNH